MKRKLVSIVAMCAAAGLLTACGPHEPLDEAPPAPPGEFEEGPGLITGADGGFVIYGGDRKKRRY